MLFRGTVTRRALASQIGQLNRQPNGFLKSVVAQGYATSPLRREQSPAASFASEKRPPSKKGSIYEKLSLNGKVTVITGGARGIGLAIGEAMAELGSNVALMDRIEPQADVQELERLHGTRFKYYCTDVEKHESLKNSFDEVVKDFGRLDNCVTAAGIALDKPFLDHTWEESQRVLSVNVMGTFFSAQLAAKHMINTGNGGSIVMIASIAAHCAIPCQRVSIYGASKGAVKLLGKTLAVEMAPYSIRVNTLSPGFIATDMTGAMTVTHPELLRVFSDTPPLGRMGEKGDLTSAVAYFLCDAASYTTGADLAVTGGLHAGRIQV